MTQQDKLRLANAARKEALSAQRYVIAWRSGRVEQSVPMERVVAVLGLKLLSVRCMLSQGKGAWSWTRTNPDSGEPDTVTVLRLEPEPIPKLKRGRPRTRPASDADAKLATEQYGITLASPARRVPKDRNRRTDEK